MSDKFVTVDGAQVCHEELIRQGWTPPPEKTALEKFDEFIEKKAESPDNIMRLNILKRTGYSIMLVAPDCAPYATPASLRDLAAWLHDAAYLWEEVMNHG